MEQHSSINVFDIFVVGVLLGSGVFAFRRGLVSEILSLGTWVLASVFAWSFFDVTRPLLHEQIQNDMLADAATGLGLFSLAIIILIPLVDYLLSYVKGPTLSSIDRSLGFVFGIVRGFLIMCLLFLVVTYVWPEGKEGQEEGKKTEQPKWLAEAKTKPALRYGMEMLKSLAPEDAEKALAEGLDKSREAANEAAENAKRLEEISVPVPTYTGGNDRTPSSYGDNARENMDKIIDRTDIQ
jgi:membrane protein required for colicin V production